MMPNSMDECVIRAFEGDCESQFQLPVLDNDILEAMEDYSMLFLNGTD
jgi:hypothetical protein